MNTNKFKTTLKCTGCLARLTPFLNQALGENKWNVDMESPDKVLTVSSDEDKQKVIEAVEKAAYKAALL